MPDVTLEIVESTPINLTLSGGTGVPGDGLPTGGTVGQVLTKLNSTDYAAEWANPGAASNLETYAAGENVSAGRLVIIDGGEAFYYQISDPTHAGRSFGITKSSATTGNNVTIQPSGIVTDAGFSALTEGTVWAIANGQVSSTRPTSGNVQKVGVYLGSNKILIDFSQQIILI